MNYEANRDDMEWHLELLMEPARGDIEHLIEFRALGGGSPDVWKTSTDRDDIDNAITRAIEQNHAGRNLYVTVNPVNLGTRGAATDQDIIGAYYAFADADTEESAVRLRIANPRPDFLVITGTQPFERLHAYWRIDKRMDLAAWAELQSGIIHSLGTDPTIKNPSRIMRLAGSLTYPDNGKKSRGYISELVRLEVLK